MNADGVPGLSPKNGGVPYPPALGLFPAALASGVWKFESGAQQTWVGGCFITQIKQRYPYVPSPLSPVDTLLKKGLLPNPVSLARVQEGPGAHPPRMHTQAGFPSGSVPVGISETVRSAMISGPQVPLLSLESSPLPRLTWPLARRVQRESPGAGASQGC